MRMQGKIALITGAGSGIGRAIAELFAAEGAEVWINDVNGDAAGAVAASIGPRAHAVPADVASVDQVKAMFSELDRTSERLDVLVNNAGIAGVAATDTPAMHQTFRAQMSELSAGGRIQTHLDATVSLSDEAWARMFAVHVNGTFYCTREALRIMGRVNRGAIVNVSSVAALTGLPGAPHYSAAKGAILSFTRAVAQDVASRNIRVNALCPGWVDTPMIAPMQADTVMSNIMRARTPLGRFAEPREIATAALFLATDDSSYVTGQYLSPNGGGFIG
jgi:3-oxoacyl-[acyl-carrier protein] reductase